LAALFIIFTWPTRLVEPLAQRAELSQMHQVGLNWAAVALWIEFLIVVFGLFGAASAIRDLFLGAPGTKASARFWRFWAVALFPVVTAATVGMALAPEPTPTPHAARPGTVSSAPSPSATDAIRPQGIPATAQRVRIVNVINGDTLRVQAEAPGSVLSSTGKALVRLLGVRAPHGAECRAAWAAERLEGQLPPGSYAWIARGAGSRGAGTPLAVYAWREGKDRAAVNARLLADGSGRLVTKEVSGQVRLRFQEYQTRAAAARRGVHACGS